MALRFYLAVWAAAPGGSVGMVFPDLPGGVGGGADAQEASLHAVAALGLHVEAMLVDGHAIPEPSALGAVPDWLAEDAGTVLGYCLVPVDLPSEAFGDVRFRVECWRFFGFRLFGRFGHGNLCFQAKQEFALG